MQTVVSKYYRRGNVVAAHYSPVFSGFFAVIVVTLCPEACSLELAVVAIRVCVNSTSVIEVCARLLASYSK